MCALSSAPFPNPLSAPGTTAGVPVTPSCRILGRDSEIGQILSLLDRDDLRIVTLLGPGGVGKTRLAQEVVRILAPNFAHGARFVPLEAIRDPDLVPKAVAQLLGLQESADLTAAELLNDMLADRHLLLVLDNMEQVVGAASPWLSDLISHAPRLRVLVTSRIALNIACEQQFIVPPLPIPDGQVEESAAVTLFAERARAVHHAFELDDETTSIVAEICRQLDGLPLAIELAAARMKILSPQVLLARFTDRLTLLTGGHQDIPLRLRSMRDAIGWSYDLLSRDEQRLFRRLSVFLGGFTLESAGFVARWEDSPETDPQGIDTLQSLVDQSLIQPMPDAVDTRFRMLETIREYGLREVLKHGEVDEAYGAHADYVRNLAHHAEIALTGPDQAMWLDRLEAEYPNIRAAMTWLETHGRLDEAIEINVQLQFFLEVRGHSIEMLERVESWLGLPEIASRTRSRGMALLSAGGFLLKTDDSNRSITSLAEAADILQEVGDLRHAAVAHETLSAIGMHVHMYEQMRIAAATALEIAEPLGLHRIVSTSLDHLSLYAGLTGDADLARKLMQQSFDVAWAGGDLSVLAYHSCSHSDEAALQRDFDRAEHFAQEALRLMQALGSRVDLPNAWGRLAWIALRRGDLELAAKNITTALSIAESCGNLLLVTHMMMRKGIIDAERGEFATAAEELQKALSYYERHRHVTDIAFCLDAYAFLATRAGDALPATRFLSASDALLQQVGVDQQILSDVVDLAGAFRQRGALRSMLGAAVFDRGYREGASLATHAAVAEALAYKPSSPQAEKKDEAALGVDLSSREMDVLKLMTNGLSNQQIADTLFLSLRTVTTHVTKIFTKLGVQSRTAAVSCAIRHGID
ncbi:MAG TPA: LuxR C-terminal-related transcriptional regulator [Thermomicrobiales bacterium]|nr:LuxR C-terminal-related transcriptional regulator [Thermomicrobiales bacterium]